MTFKSKDCSYVLKDTQGQTKDIINMLLLLLMMMTLLCSARELELEDRQSRLEAQLRERIASEGNLKTPC